MTGEYYFNFINTFIFRLLDEDESRGISGFGGSFPVAPAPARPRGVDDGERGEN